MIVSNRKSSASTTTAAPSTTRAVSAGKASYSSIERGSSGERNVNDIQTRGKGRAQALPPAPVTEDVVSMGKNLNFLIVIT